MASGKLEAIVGHNLPAMAQSILTSSTFTACRAAISGIVAQGIEPVSASVRKASCVAVPTRAGLESSLMAIAAGRAEPGQRKAGGIALARRSRVAVISTPGRGGGGHAKKGPVY